MSLGKSRVGTDELCERQSIIDCIHRYTRGVDRLDEELILSAFHEDAVDCHGPTVGSPRDFVAWLWPRHEDRIATQHCVTNHTFDFDGDVAHVETYFTTPIRRRDRADIEIVGGRYVDRFEKRGGEWRIAYRVVVQDWHATADALPVVPESDIGTRDRRDVSYQRPLVSRPGPIERRAQTGGAGS